MLRINDAYTDLPGRFHSTMYQIHTSSILRKDNTLPGRIREAFNAGNGVSLSTASRDYIV